MVLLDTGFWIIDKPPKPGSFGLCLESSKSCPWRNNHIIAYIYIYIHYTSMPGDIIYIYMVLDVSKMRSKQSSNVLPSPGVAGHANV